MSLSLPCIALSIVETPTESVLVAGVVELMEKGDVPLTIVLRHNPCEKTFAKGFSGLSGIGRGCSCHFPFGIDRGYGRTQKSDAPNLIRAVSILEERGENQLVVLLHAFRAVIHITANGGEFTVLGK